MGRGLLCWLLVSEILLSAVVIFLISFGLGLCQLLSGCFGDYFLVLKSWEKRYAGEVQVANIHTHTYARSASFP